MLIVEALDGRLKIYDSFEKKITTIQTLPEIIEDGDIKDISVICGAIKSKLISIIDEGVVFVLHSSKIISKEIQIQKASKSKQKIIIGLEIKEHFNELEGDYVYTYNILEKTRVVLYAAPKTMIDKYIELAEMLGKDIIAIDTSDNALLQHVINVAGNTSNLVVYFSGETAKISVIKNGVIKLQSTINSTNIEKIIMAASRTIKYYSDKNKKERLNRVYIYNSNTNQEDVILKNRIEEELKLTANLVLDEEVYNVGKITSEVNFAKNEYIQDKGISRYFSVYRLVVIFAIGIALYLMAPPTVNYIYAVSERNEAKGDVQAIDDIVDIKAEYDHNHKAYNIAINYEAIINCLPEDSREISVAVRENGATVTAKTDTPVDERVIIDKCKNAVISYIDGEVTVSFEMEDK